MTFEKAVEQETQGVMMLADVIDGEPVFPRIVNHPLTVRFMNSLIENTTKFKPETTVLDILRVAFAQGVAVGVRMSTAADETPRIDLRPC